MTELEKIAYAKTFIDKLANGINPINGSVIPEDDIVNNVRLSRCFFYVSDLLRQIIDNGGITPPPVAVERKLRKQPYFLTPEQAASFEYSDTPITASEIFNRISAVGPTEGVKKLPKRNLVKWLISLDLLEGVDVNGEWVKRPTPEGEEMGITLEERQGQYGTYFVVLYNKDAQHFILDNIEAVLAFDSRIYREKMNLDNQGKVWGEDEDKELLRLYGEGNSVGEIAKALKRGERAVRLRLGRRGIHPDLEAPADTPASVATRKEDSTSFEDKGENAPEKAELREDLEGAEPKETGYANEKHGVSAAGAELRETHSSSAAVTPSPEKKSCRSCKFARSGDCFPQKEICPDYEPAFDVPKDERSLWPEMGDASFLRQNGRRRE